MPRSVLNFIALMIFLSVFIICNNANAEESTLSYRKNTSYKQLNESFIQFSNNFYNLLSQKYPQNTPISLDLIISEAEHAYKIGKPSYAIGLIVSHKKQLKNNVNAKYFILAETLLLSADEFETAHELLLSAEQNADPAILANVRYAYAEYYFRHNAWDKVIDTIDDIANDLPAEKFSHAMLIKGVSLQNLHRHRESLIAYGKIPQASPDFVTAKINTAIANFRQDWWTDAYETLENLLKMSDISKNEKLSDRIHTLIGYIFLQQDYYRNSRNAFRKVNLSGKYTHQALMGIALDAAYQKDYVGALNAANILKNKYAHALQVDEAHLLVPYFYEKLGQNSTASAGYSDAIAYFRMKIIELNSEISKLPDTYTHALNTDNHLLTTGKYKMDLSSDFPDAFFRQYSLLNDYASDITKLSNPALTNSYARLRNSFNSAIQNSAAANLNRKKSFLEDYMNQARYGLARLYDNPLVKQ